MKQELEDQLVKEFPLLFADRHVSPMQSTFAFGFECDDGWEPIIRAAALQLEPLIQQYIDTHPDLRCICGCPASAHHVNTSSRLCQSVFRRPVLNLRTHWGYIVPKQWYKRFYQYLKHKWHNWLASCLFWMADKGISYKEKLCPCTGYKPDYPRAAQVKEKFGTLRFYLTFGTDEMYKIISVTEDISATVCESCGSTGNLRTDLGWVRTLCDTCYTPLKKELGKKSNEYKEALLQRATSNSAVATVLAMGGDKSRGTSNS